MENRLADPYFKKKALTWSDLDDITEYQINKEKADLKAAADRYLVHGNRLYTEAQKNIDTEFGDYEDENTFSDYQTRFSKQNAQVSKDAYYAKKYYELYGTEADIENYKEVLSHDAYLKTYSDFLKGSGNLSDKKAAAQYQNLLNFDIEAATKEVEELKESVYDTQGYVTTMDKDKKDQIDKLTERIQMAQQVQANAKQQQENAEQQQKATEELSTLDLKELADNIARLEKKCSELKERSKTSMEFTPDWVYAEAELQNALTLYNRAAKVQTRKSVNQVYENYRSDENFEKYAEAGSKIEDNINVMDDNYRSPGYEDPEQRINKLLGWVEKVDCLSDDQKKMYNYIKAKYGWEEALAYIDFHGDELNQKIAQKRAENADGWERWRAGISASLSSWGRNAMGLLKMVTGNEEVTPLTIDEYESQMVTQYMSDGEKFLFDFFNSTLNSAPAIIAGIASGGTLLPVFIGLDAAGRSYNEAIREGYSGNRAYANAMVTGIVKGFLSKKLNVFGDGKISTAWTNTVKSAASSLTSSEAASNILAIAFGVSGKGLGQFGEEYLESVMEPVLKNLTLGQNNPIDFFSSDALYAGLVGGFSGMVFGGIEIAKSHKIGKSFVSQTSQSADGKISNTSQNDAAKILTGIADSLGENENQTIKNRVNFMNRIMDNGGTVSAIDIGDLYANLNNVMGGNAFARALDGGGKYGDWDAKNVISAVEDEKNKIESSLEEGKIDNETLESVEEALKAQTGHLEVNPEILHQKATDGELMLSDQKTNDTTGFPIPTGKSNGVLTVGNTSSDIENVEVIGVASSGIKNSISYKLSDGRVVSGDSVRLTNPEIETAMIDARTNMSTPAANSYFYALQEAQENSSDLNLRMFKNQYNGLMEYANLGAEGLVSATSTDADIANAAGSMAEKLLNQGGDLYSEMTPDSMIRALYSGLEQRVEVAKLQEGRITPNDLPNSTSANIPDAPQSALTESDPQGNINESTTFDEVIKDDGEIAGSGKKTVDQLINGLKETTNGKGIARNFETSGGYTQILKDFKGLNPVYIKDIQTKYGPGKVGTLNDGTKVVARQGSTTAGPTLEIKVSNSKVYKIRY